jgi:nucleoside-diphosphate-sugar epimerase
VKKNILIIGGTGRIGTFLLDELKNHQNAFNQIHIISRRGGKNDELDFITNWKLKNDRLSTYEEIFRNHEIDIILHIPNLLSQDSPIEYLLTNAPKSASLIFIGSAAIFTNIKGAKTRGLRIEREKLIRESERNYCIIRPTMIFGHPQDGNIFKLFRVVKKYPILAAPSTLNSKQNPVYIKDLVKVIVIFLTKEPIRNQELNIAGPKPITFKEMVSALNGKPKLIIPIPTAPIKVLLKLLRKMGFKVWHPEKIDRFSEDKVIDQGAAYLEKYGYQPTPFQDAVKCYENL